MMVRLRQIGTIIAALAFALASGMRSPAQSSNQAQVSGTLQTGVLFKVNSELILTNVVARDVKTGELIRGLQRGDFTIYENGKQQQISTFDFESVEMAAPLNEATISGLAAEEAAKLSLPAPRICATIASSLCFLT